MSDLRPIAFAFVADRHPQYPSATDSNTSPNKTRQCCGRSVHTWARWQAEVADR
jgi:hypothetical protein